MVIKAENLSVTIDGGTPLFEDVTFSLEAGEFALLAGGPGSGKTILGLTLSGLLPVVAEEHRIDGRIELFGRDVKTGQNRGEVSIILENPYVQLSGMKRTVRHELAFPLESRGIGSGEIASRIERYAEMFGIDRLLDRGVRTLSGGELQRVLIACALITHPRFIFLDRPLIEIDPEFRPELMEIIRTHLIEADGAALIAEDSWLLHGFHFEKEINLGSAKDGASIAPSKVQDDREVIELSDGSKLFRAEDVTFGYDNSDPVVSGLSFSIGSGQVSFVTGANGAGKTTLAKLIAGILKPSSGSIAIDGRPVASMSEYDHMSLVGFALQNPALQICRRTVRDEIELAEKWGNPPGEFTEIMGIDRLLDSHPLEITQAEKKRLGIAFACGGPRKVVVLDEPSQYQDADGFARVVDALNQCMSEGKCALVITHDPRFFAAFPDAGIIRLSQANNS